MLNEDNTVTGDIISSDMFESYFHDRYDGKHDPRCRRCDSICCTYCSVANPEIEEYIKRLKEITENA